MEDLKSVIAKNIASLRQSAGMTQLEFAERLNYSDKAVSKWERGDSLPDVTVLMRIAEMFGVTLNYLVEETHEIPTAVAEPPAVNPNRTRNRALLTAIGMLLVWIAATFCFVMIDFSVGGIRYHWLAFVWAVPASIVVWLVFNSIWFKRHRNYLIVSFLMWTFLVATYLSFLPFGYNIWLVFILGVPIQVVIFLSANLKYKSN